MISNSCLYLKVLKMEYIIKVIKHLSNVNPNKEEINLVI